MPLCNPDPVLVGKVCTFLFVTENFVNFFRKVLPLRFRENMEHILRNFYTDQPGDVFEHGQPSSADPCA